VAAAGQAAELASTPEQHHQIAHLLASQGQTERAIAYLEQALDARPGHTLWYGELGNLYAGQSNWPAAQGCYCQLAALESGPQRAAALLKLATVLRAQDKLPAALQAVSKAAHLQPQNPQALEAWTTTAHAARQWEETIHAGQAALALQPNSAQLHLLMGGALAAQNQDNEALYHLRRATRLTVAEPQVGVRPADTWLALAEFYERRGELAQAEQTWNDGIQAVRQLQDTDSAPLLFRQAQLYQQSGRLTEAQAAYWRAYQAGDHSSALLTRLGRVLNQLGHHQQAITKLQESVALPDAGGESYHALALALESVGRTSEAAAAARQATLLNPQEAQILLDAGRLCLADQNAPEAIALLKTAAAQSADTPAIWEWLGRALEAENDWNAALEAYTSAARLEPNNPSLNHRIGIVCTRLGQYETAIASLQEAASHAPDDPAVRDAMAEAFEGARWWNRAALARAEAAKLTPSDPVRLVAWARAARHAQDFPAAGEAIAHAQQVAPDSQRLLLERGLLRQAKGDLAGASQLLRELVRACQQLPLLLRAGQALIKLEQSNAAAAAFARAVDLEPNNPVAQSQLGIASAALGNLSQALAAYQKAAHLEPANPAHQIAIGEMHWELNNFSQAAQDWAAALDLAPADASIAERLARAHVRLDDPAAALVMFERAATRAAQAGSNSLQTAPIWREAGRAALSLGELDKARNFMTRALRYAPRDPETRSLVGALAERLGKPDEAVEAYRRAAGLAPPEAQRAYQLQLADALTRNGQDMEAVEVWQGLVSVASKTDQTAGMLEQMGRLYARAGRYQDAEGALRTALRHSPDNKSIQLQLSGVLVELAEREDYQRRGAMTVTDKSADLHKVIAWLVGTDAPQGQRDLARAQALLGGVNEAIAGLNAYLSNTRSDLSAQRALGIAYRLANLPEASLDALSTAVRQAPTDVRTSVELAQSYLAAGKPQTAATLLDRLVCQLPACAMAYYFLAMARQTSGETGAAIEALQQALTLQPEVGNWQRTLSAWLRAEGQLLAALPHAEEAVEVEDDAQARAELARVLTALGRAEEATPLWEAALELAPDNADWWLALGELLLSVDRPAQAAACCEQAALGPSNNPHLHLGWARALLALGRLDEAQQQVERALELAPDLPAARAGMGYWQAAGGKWHDALASFQAATLLASNGASAPPAERANYLLQIAHAYHALESPEQALQQLDNAVRLAPNLGAAFALMGEIHRELGNRDSARQAYQQAAKVAPAIPRYTLQLARFLQVEGQLDQALDWLIKAIAARPAAELWLAAAQIYQQRGQRGKRIEALHRAVAQEPAHAKAHFELGLAYKQRKEYQLAIDAFERVIALDPKNERAHKQLSAVVAISLAGRMGRGRG